MKSVYLEKCNMLKAQIELADVGYRQKIKNLGNCLSNAIPEEVGDLLEDFNAYKKAYEDLQESLRRYQEYYRKEVEKGKEVADDARAREAFGDRWDELNKEGEVVVCG